MTKVQNLARQQRLASACRGQDKELVSLRFSADSRQSLQDSVHDLEEKYF